MQHGVVSVSILANTCTLADALATAILVLGVNDGLELLNSLANVEGLILEKTEDGLRSHRTENFYLNTELLN